MGIHGDKSQQERDWVLNGKLFPHLLIRFSALTKCFGFLIIPVFLFYFIFFICRVQVWKGSNSHCYRCCLQRSRSVSSLICSVLLIYLEKESICFL